jgi:hypothetical protein
MRWKFEGAAARRPGCGCHGRAAAQLRSLLGCLLAAALSRPQGGVSPAGVDDEIQVGGWDSNRARSEGGAGVSPLLDLVKLLVRDGEQDPSRRFLSRLGPLDEHPVDERGAGADEGDELGCVDGAPAVLRCFDELEGHGQPGCPRAGALSDLGAVADVDSIGLVVRRCTQCSAG